MTKPSCFDIRDFGAVPDGRTLCTGAFTATIRSAAACGGTVIVPAGEFLTGPITLESNLSLWLDAGSRIVFSSNLADYPVIFSRWEGRDGNVYSPQIYGRGLENVTISGSGTLDGQGQSWWRLFREKRLDHPRPRLISLEDCSHILIEGIRLVNSPSWTIHPLFCRDLAITGVKIDNPADSPNTDGIDPDSCQDVRIEECQIDVGDDCIAIKSGTEAASKKVASEKIVIAHCIMRHGHGGVVMGSEMSGGISDVTVTDCTFYGTDRGIRIKSRRGRGGTIEDITARRITMEKVACPLAINLFYRCGPGGDDEIVRDKNPLPIGEKTPIVRGIILEEITAKNVGIAAGFCYGLPEQPVTGLHLRDIRVELSESATPGLPEMMLDIEPISRKGFIGFNLKDVTFEQVRVSGQQGPAFEITQSDEVRYINSPEN